MTPEQAKRITKDWILANVDLARAAQTWEDFPIRGERTKRTVRLNYVAPYEWAWDKYLGDMMRLVTVRVGQVMPSEGDWDNALNMASTRQYIEWYRQGYSPPPIVVIENQHGELISLNRRRWLAAREAGIETLSAWFSPVDGLRPQWQIFACNQRREITICQRKPDKSCIGCRIFEEV